jgi:TatD DNase family protein
MNLMEFHCHLDLFSEHPKEFSEREIHGVYTLAVTTTPKAWPQNRDLAAGTRHVRAGLGLHPQLVSLGMAEFEIWEKYLPEAPFVGEVGLDAGPRYYKSFDKQKEVFGRVLRACAEQGGRVLSVHSVRAVTVVLDMIEKDLPPSRGTVVLHWFTGTHSEARRAVELGCYFSINGEMFRKEQHRRLVAFLPSARILTESDGPFVTPPLNASYVDVLGRTIESMAQVRNVDAATIMQLVRSNALRLLGERSG